MGTAHPGTAPDRRHRFFQDDCGAEVTEHDLPPQPPFCTSEPTVNCENMRVPLLKSVMKNLFIAICVATLLSGCAATRPNLSDSEIATKISAFSAKAMNAPTNPRHGEVIWGNLKVGMTVREVLQAVPNSYFDDQWGSQGAVGAMGEAGVFAKEKVLVTGEISGPFGGPSSFFGLFDEWGRLDGIVILTLKKGLSPEINKLYGSIGFNLAEFKEAARLIIKSAPPELGKRSGAPKLGKEQMDSIGSVGVATSISGNKAIGVGIPMPSMSPTTITQKYEREGYKSTFVIRTIYLGLYGVYAAPLVTIGIQTKTANDSDVPDVE